MYHKILDAAVRGIETAKNSQEPSKLRSQQQDDFVSDCSIDTDLEILIPDDYVEYYNGKAASEAARGRLDNL